MSDNTPLSFNKEVVNEASLHFINKPGDMTCVRIKINDTWIDTEEGKAFLQRIMDDDLGTQGLEMCMIMANMLAETPGAIKQQGTYDG